MMHDETEQALLVAEAHLGLGRMHIHIHEGWIHG